MYRTLLQLIPLTLALLAGPVSAAEPDVDAPETTSADESPEQEPRASADGTPSSEVFIPTEEISEDFAVSFPVDI